MFFVECFEFKANQLGKPTGWLENGLQMSYTQVKDLIVFAGSLLNRTTKT